MPTRFAIAAIVVNPNNKDEVLAVKRPPTDDKLPNVWGAACHNAGRGRAAGGCGQALGRREVKLHTQIEPTAYLGVRRDDRGTYELILMDIEAKLVGKEPSVQDAVTAGTKYVDQQWTSDYALLKMLPPKAPCARKSS